MGYPLFLRQYCCTFTSKTLARPTVALLSLRTLQDHIGAAGLVADYFAADEPVAISSRRSRWALKAKDKGDPDTVFGNNRGVPLPEWYQEEVLEVGGLRFALDKIHIHQAGDYLIRLDKNDPTNADSGTTRTKVRRVYVGDYCIIWPSILSKERLFVYISGVRGGRHTLELIRLLVCCVCVTAMYQRFFYS